MRILLVEDDDSIREVFKLVLETAEPLAGSTIDTAASGCEALEKVRGVRPDVVLLDMTLAGESGLDVFRQLRELEGCADLPVIAVTAHNVLELQREASRLGFAGYVTKPIDFETSLFPLIRSILDRVAEGRAA